jgi:hypothetical protein
MTIHLSIRKELYRDYFIHLFPTDPSGALQITRDSDLGKLICALVRYSDFPVKDQIPEDAIQIKLPATNSLRIAQDRFLFLSREDQLRINDLIEVFFNIDFDRYYLKGLKIGLQQKEIIESFIVTRKLTRLMSDNETLKKRQYRQELDLLKERVEQLRQRAYYRNQKIEFEPEKYLIN